MRNGPAVRWAILVFREVCTGQGRSNKCGARLTEREKLIAARRAGITAISLPEDHGGEFEEVPDHVHQGLKVHFYARLGDLVPYRFRETEAGKRGLQ